MNILIFNWRGPKHPNAGGAEIVTHEYAKAWARHGHTVTLFTSSFSGGKEHEVIDGVEIIRKGRTVFGVQFEAFLWYVFSNHKSFDLVIDQFHGIPFFTPLYVRTRKLAFIHEVVKELWKLNPWPKPFHIIPHIIGTICEPWMFQILYRRIPFLTVSESTRNDLMEWGISRGNITIIHNGIHPLKTSSLPSKEKKKTILYLGALAKDKGIEDALHIFSLVKKLHPSWQFWIAGNCDAQYLRKLKMLAKQLEVEDVIFWGFVSEKKKFELLSRAHILLNPSVREGWGLVNIEANSVGTPVVSYDVPGCRDSIVNGRTGILVPVQEHKKMVDAIVSITSNEKRYAKMKGYALQWSKRFTWEKSIQESLTLLNKMNIVSK